MRLAVPVTGGMLSAHFGHCENFAIFDIDEQSKKILKKELIQPPPHEPGLLPKWLAERGVNFIIAGGMGSRAQALFQQNDIGVIMGAMENDPEKAVLNYLEGCLTTGDNFCDH